MARRVEAWLTPAPDGVPAELVPAAQMLLQARAELEESLSGISTTQLWVKPGGAASIAFHLHHIAGSIDRLLTYVAGKQLSESQLAALAAEPETNPNLNAAFLLEGATGEIKRALLVYHDLDPSDWFEPREVGRSRLPSTVFGLLYHVAEHTVRHTGQVVTTAKVVRGL